MEDIVKKGLEAEEMIRKWHRAIGHEKVDIISFDLIALVQYVIEETKKGG